MKNFFRPVCWFIVLLLFAQGVSAGKRDSIQCTCNRNDYSPAGVMIGMRHLKGMWMFSYNYMNMQMQNNLSGTSSVSDEAVFSKYIMSPESMRMDMHMLMGMYGLSDRITLMTMLQYDVLKMNMQMLSGSTHNHGGTMDMNASQTEMESRSYGFSDTKLLALWSFYVHKGNTLMLSGGVSVPTGSINKKGVESDIMYHNLQLPYMMLTGSGTVDFLPGLTYLYFKNNFEFSAQATGVVRPFYNSIGYRLGNELSLNTWASYQLFGSLAPSLRLEGTVSDKIQGYDPRFFRGMEPGASPENYGGKKINGYFGVSFYFKKLPVVRNSRILAEYGMPLYQNVNGIQLSQRSTLSAAWRFAF